MNFVLKNKWDFSLNPPWIPTPHFYRKPHTLLLWIIFGDLITSSNKNGRVPRMAQRHIFHYIFWLIDHQEPWSRKGSLNLIKHPLGLERVSFRSWVQRVNTLDPLSHRNTLNPHSTTILRKFKVKRFWPATLCNVLGYNLWKTAWQSK